MLRQARPALEGERKHITVLFADVKGSMNLAERFDPEQWFRIVEDFFQVVADGVHRSEGTVNQFTGDGVMALFHRSKVAHRCHGCKTHSGKTLSQRCADGREPRD